MPQVRGRSRHTFRGIVVGLGLRLAPGAVMVVSGSRLQQSLHKKPPGREHPGVNHWALREGPEVKFAVMARHRHLWPVSVMSRLLGVTRAGFYAWLCRPESERAQTDQQLSVEIRRSFIESDQTYGARRVRRDLRAWGHRCGRRRVRRLMRLSQLNARPKRRRRPFDAGQRLEHMIAPNLLLFFYRPIT